MGILAKVNTNYGEDKELYIRLNHVEASNHGEDSTATFRGFTSQEAFKNGKSFMYEVSVSFVIDASKPIWEQAYKALCEQEGFEGVEA